MKGILEKGKLYYHNSYGYLAGYSMIPRSGQRLESENLIQAKEMMLFLGGRQFSYDLDSHCWQFYHLKSHRIIWLPLSSESIKMWIIELLDDPE